MYKFISMQEKKVAIVTNVVEGMKGGMSHSVHNTDCFGVNAFRTDKPVRRRKIIDEKRSREKKKKKRKKEEKNRY